jgi:hypothetical protein
MVGLPNNTIPRVYFCIWAQLELPKLPEKVKEYCIYSNLKYYFCNFSVLVFLAEILKEKGVY